MMDIKKQSGFSLIELVIVIIVLGITASIAVRSLAPAVDEERLRTTLEEMRTLKNAVVGNPELIAGGMRTDFGYFGDNGSMPGSLDDLIANPGMATWNGPYIDGRFLEYPDDFKQDSWGNAYIYSGLNLTSNTDGTPVTVNFAENLIDLTSNTVMGNITDALGIAPGDSAVSVEITIEFPDGSGSITSITNNPDNAGVFSFSSVVPIGNHKITAIYPSGTDTTAVYVSVLPNSQIYCDLKFSRAHW